MDGFLLARVFGDWLFGVSALISIINPLGIVFVFHDITRDLPAALRARLVRAVTRNSFLVIVVSMLLGARILAFFGISLEALRIAGGLIDAISGWTMLVAEPPPETRDDHQTRDPIVVAQQGFFPLTVPLTTGPGSIATAIALAAERPSSRDGYLAAGIVAALVAGTVALLIWLTYRKAELIARRMGPEGSLVATKISAFLLLCVGVQIVLTGSGDALHRIFPGR